jgi:hypothetical protein
MTGDDSGDRGVGGGPNRLFISPKKLSMHAKATQDATSLSVSKRNQVGLLPRLQRQENGDLVMLVTDTHLAAFHQLQNIPHFEADLKHGSTPPSNGGRFYFSSPRPIINLALTHSRYCLSTYPRAFSLHETPRSFSASTVISKFFLHFTFVWCSSVLVTHRLVH